MRIKIILMVLVAVGICQANAVERYVPLQYSTIQAAIDAANNGDTIIVSPGTYTSDGNRDIDFKGKAITLRSTDPNNPAVTIIDCNGGWLDGHRGFYFHSGEDNNSILDGLTIKGGLAWGGDGGGILIENSSPTIRNCTIRDNSTFFDMVAGDAGGGISCENNSTPVIINCTITRNSSGVGGGVFCVDSKPTFIDCKISHNSADNGGGMFSCCYSDPVLNNCAITQNVASMGAGGGICCTSDSNPILTNTTIVANIANGAGGGILCGQNSSPKINNCLIIGNRSEDPTTLTYGGGIYCEDNSNPIFTNCTIAYNYTNCNGGGIYCSFSNPIIMNSILWGNMADSSGSQIALSYPSGPSTLTVSYCNIQGGRTEAYIENNCSLNWLTGNIDIDPCFADAANGDYHLKSEGWYWDSQRQRWDYSDVTSRCIDAGNPGSPLGDEPLTIPDDPENMWGENLRIDMGAYGGTAEASVPPYGWAMLGDLNNDGIVNSYDYAYFASDWLDAGIQQPGDLNRDGIINFDDLGLLVEDWLKETTWR